MRRLFALLSFIASPLAAQQIGVGDVRIIAQWMIGQTFKASTTLVHVAPASLATLLVSVPTTLIKGQSVCPVAVGRDQFGKPFTGAPIKWSSSDTSLVRIATPTALQTTGGPLISCPLSDTTVAVAPLQPIFPPVPPGS